MSKISIIKNPIQVFLAAGRPAASNESRSAHLSYEGGVRKWGSDFCAQVELLVVHDICSREGDASTQRSRRSVFQLSCLREKKCKS